jgi:hypothetical protein
MNNRYHAVDYGGYFRVERNNMSFCVACGSAVDGDKTGEQAARMIADALNAQLDAAPKQSPFITDAEARRREKRRHDDAAAFMAASMMRDGLSDLPPDCLANCSVEHADALHAALEKGGAK